MEAVTHMIETLDFGLLVAIVLGLTQILKQTFVGSKLVPFIALLIGVGTSFLFEGISTTAVITGLVASLSAMGLFSGGKATFS